MSKIKKLYLFVHPMPRHPDTLKRYMPLWERLIADEGPTEENAICVLSNSPKEMELLRTWAKKAFGNRCVIDPNDNSTKTRLLLADDLERTLRARGSYTEWIPYEIWTSNNARRWTEGLKREWAARGHSYSPETLVVEACGQQWGGCLTKYAIFMPKYLGLKRATDVNAALSPDAGYPIKAEFRERIAMDRHVWLFLFETADGLAMGQFMDGLRAVWEPPHVVSVKIDPSRVDVVASSPNGYVKVDEATKVVGDTVVADVGDGCHPAYTTLVGKGMSLGELRAALAAGKVSPLAARRRVFYSVPYADPITASRDRP